MRVKLIREIGMGMGEGEWVSEREKRGERWLRYIYKDVF